MRIYIAGPMSGIAQHNFPAFNAEAARLRAQGHEVISPAEINAAHQADSWSVCMRRDLEQLITCEAVQLLPRYQWSRGARLELYVARELGLKVFQPVCEFAPTE